MPELHPGDPRQLGSYELLERLGEGGQGVVYLGRDQGGTKVAIKLLRADLTEDETARTRFVREVQAAKQVARFCTAQVLEADVAGDRPYIVSEYVPGPSLQRQVTEEGPRTGATLDRLAIGTLTALVAIHQAGIVHRDFKPHNVLIAPDGPRVIDFGIARALDAGSTQSTKAIGTPAYMAPEQVTGAQVTEAVDMFSWASTMVYAATGQPPFGQDSIPAVINRILNEQPTLDGVPDNMRELLRVCLSKDPQARPTAQELMMRLIGGDTGEQPVESATRLDQPAVPGELPTEVLRRGEDMAEGTPPATDPTRRFGAVGAGAAGAGAMGAMGGTMAGPSAAQTLAGQPVQYTGHRDPSQRSQWPLIGAVVAVAAIALLIGGLVYALNRGDSPQAPTVVPTSATTSGPEQSSEPEQPQDTESDEPEQPSQTPTQPEQPEQPTSSPTSEPSSPEPSSPEPSGDGGGSGGDGGDGGGSGGGGGSSSPDTGQGGSQAAPTP